VISDRSTSGVLNLHHLRAGSEPVQRDRCLWLIQPTTSVTCINHLFCAIAAWSCPLNQSGIESKKGVGLSEQSSNQVTTRTDVITAEARPRCTESHVTNPHGANTRGACNFAEVTHRSVAAARTVPEAVISSYQGAAVEAVVRGSIESPAHLVLPLAPHTRGFRRLKPVPAIHDLVEIKR